ncbi:hypothetical protein AGR9A_Lc40292 [Agrobacterium salinitolerans str. Hayward 0363]|nr:hypothetical protein AGR9A_Lc40292 [Agrobacterium salinitolerans str. Hayward 0363]
MVGQHLGGRRGSERSIRVAFADASLCIDMEVWQQQFSRKVERLRIMKNKTFSSALQGSPKALPTLYPPLPKKDCVVIAMPGIVQKRERGCNTFKWFTGPEICFAQLSCLNTGPKTA